MSKRKVLIALSTFAQYGREPLEVLEKQGYEIILNKTGRRLKQDEIISLGKDAEGVIAGVEPYDDHVLDSMKNLKCISRCGVGIDNISPIKAGEKGIKILNTPDVVIQPVAELTIAMIFNLVKNLSWHDRAIKNGKWEKRAGFLLEGKKIGILGLGKIGKRTAEILLKLGTEVYASDVFPDNAWADNAGVKIVSVEELLKISDVISIHLALNPDNPFIMGKDEIASMKKGAMLVNAARGCFVDEDALYEALTEKHLSGAALDVFNEEPYSGKLSGSLDNVILTPHIGTLTRESRLNMELEASNNIINYLSKLNSEK